MNNSSKILKNSLILYGRMIFSAIIGLASTRIILLSLGVDDYGIYTLVVGVVGMLTVLNSAMGTSTQRFLSHTMGENDFNKLRTIFSTSHFIHIVLAVLILILMFLARNYIINEFLNIPAHRLNVALKIYNLVVFSTFFTIATSPFDGNFVANENFLIIAVTEILISTINLVGAIVVYYSNGDKLFIYAIVTTFGAIGIAIFKQLYSVLKYKECSIIPNKISGKYFKELTSFAGWNLFTALSGMARGQGISVLMNIYFGVKVNAAYGVAGQVNGQVSSLSMVVTKAIYPQLMKAEGGGDRDRMFRLSVLTTKLPYLLTIMIGIPLTLEINYVLKLWLKEVPPNANELVVLIIILTLVTTLSSGLIAAIQSIGRIKFYHLITGVLLLLTIPIIILFYKCGYSVIWAIIISISIEILAHFFRLMYLNRIANLKISLFLKEVDMKLIAVTIIGFLSVFWITSIFQPCFLRLFVITVLSILTVSISSFYITLQREEQKLIRNILLCKIRKYKSKYLSND